MANTSSAKKAARQMVSRTIVNKARRSKYKSTVSKVEAAIAAGDATAAAVALKAAEPNIMRSANIGGISGIRALMDSGEEKNPGCYSMNTALLSLLREKKISSDDALNATTDRIGFADAR